MMRVPIYMNNPMFEEISEKIKHSYKNACVLFIDEIYNPDLESKYEEQKLKMWEINDAEPSELLLFHGTRANLIDIIAEEGFDPEKNTTSAYGRGTYFATNAVYSKDYMRSTDKRGVSYMFLAKVLVGKCGSSRDPDVDTYINSNQNPIIYVKPERYGAIPKYIVAFHKNAA